MAANGNQVQVQVKGTSETVLFSKTGKETFETKQAAFKALLDKTRGETFSSSEAAIERCKQLQEKFYALYTDEKDLQERIANEYCKMKQVSEHEKAELREETISFLKEAGYATLNPNDRYARNVHIYKAINNVTFILEWEDLRGSLLYNHCAKKNTIKK